MAETQSVKAESSQNGLSGVAASSATIQGASKFSNLVGQRVVFRHYPTGSPRNGTIVSMQGDNFAFIGEDGMPSYQLQRTVVTDILGIIAVLPFNAAKTQMPAPSKAAPSKAASTKAAPTKATPSKTAPTEAAPTEAAAVSIAPTKEEFPKLELTEAQKKAKAAVLTSPPKAATVLKTAAAVPKTAAATSKKPKRNFVEEIGDFVAAEGAAACVRAQLPALLDHTVSGKKTVKFGFPATLRFDGQHVSVGANFNKPYVLEKLREDLGIESDRIRVSISYAFKHLANGKLDVLKNGEITIFVSW